MHNENSYTDIWNFVQFLMCSIPKQLCTSQTSWKPMSCKNLIYWAIDAAVLKCKTFKTVLCEVKSFRLLRYDDGPIKLGRCHMGLTDYWWQYLESLSKALDSCCCWYSVCRVFDFDVQYICILPSWFHYPACYLQVFDRLHFIIYLRQWSLSRLVKNG